MDDSKKKNTQVIEQTNPDNKRKALEAAISAIEKSFGKG